MPSGKNLGIYWDINSFSVVESQQDIPQRIFRVPHHPAPEVDPVAPIQNFDDIQFVTPLKTALQANGIKASEVSLVLPSQDIIIRSFVIPFLKPSEIKGVVEFEIKKYIPFNLKDISFNFHAVPFVDDKVKKMRVHFVAIRKEILDRYKLILKQAGLSLVYSEPAAMCIARALIYRKIVKPDQRVAVVLSDFDDPGIFVIDKGVVQFVRDFQLQNPTLNMAPLDMETIKKKLFNEIKISLDFYIRQFKSEKLEELFNLSFSSDQDMTTELQKELDLPAKKVNVASIAKFSSTPDAGTLAAFGINLKGAAKTIDFNLSGVIAPSTQASKFKEQIPEEYIPVIKVAVICAAVLAVVMVLANMNTAQAKKRYDKVVEEQGPFVEMTPDDIQSRINENKIKLKNYHETYQPTQMAFILTHIAKVLPEGMWLTDVDVRYLDDKDANKNPSLPGISSTQSDSSEKIKFMNLDLTGYVYDKDPNQQFKIIYAFVNKLKSDETLKRFSQNVNLVSIQGEQRNDESVTNFKIRIE